MDKNLLRQVIYDQRKQSAQNNYIQRDVPSDLINCPEILVITGIRRCGKSVLLQQIRETQQQQDYFLNFDDERLVSFTVADFAMLAEVFIEDFGEQKCYYLDEIQNITGWERFVSRLYREGNKVFVTGSNANLLSRELGTFLTGRHVTLELFPFSFIEFLKLKNVEIDKSAIYSTNGKALIMREFLDYLHVGGLPQYINTENDNYLISLYNDIVFKDVVVRNKITNERPIRELIHYLASNATHRFTYNSLSKNIGVKSSETVKSYVDFIENTYMVYQLAKYDFSVGMQLRSPKKIYFIDNSLMFKIGFNATDNEGMALENAVFVELRRRGKEIFYYSNSHECDFIVREGIKITEAIQVTVTMSNEQTRTREIAGLVYAMSLFDIAEGLIITLDDEEEITDSSGRKIYVKPAWKWMLNE